jgi:hypothetical protein
MGSIRVFNAKFCVNYKLDFQSRIRFWRYVAYWYMLGITIFLSYLFSCHSVFCSQGRFSWAVRVLPSPPSTDWYGYPSLLIACALVCLLVQSWEGGRWRGDDFDQPKEMSLTVVPWSLWLSYLVAVATSMRSIWSTLNLMKSLCLLLRRT